MHHTEITFKLNKSVFHDPESYIVELLCGNGQLYKKNKDDTYTLVSNAKDADVSIIYFTEEYQWFYESLLDYALDILLLKFKKYEVEHHLNSESTSNDKSTVDCLDNMFYGNPQFWLNLFEDYCTEVIVKEAYTDEYTNECNPTLTIAKQVNNEIKFFSSGMMYDGDIFDAIC